MGLKYDLIKVYEGTSTHVHTNRSGIFAPPPVTSFSNKITVTFEIDETTLLCTDNSIIGRWAAYFTILSATEISSHRPPTMTTPAMQEPHEIFCSATRC